jgi:hypothetical protein
MRRFGDRKQNKNGSFKDQYFAHEIIVLYFTYASFTFFCICAKLLYIKYYNNKIIYYFI